MGVEEGDGVGAHEADEVGVVAGDAVVMGVEGEVGVKRVGVVLDGADHGVEGDEGVLDGDGGGDGGGRLPLGEDGDEVDEDEPEEAGVVLVEQSVANPSRDQSLANPSQDVLEGFEEGGGGGEEAGGEGGEGLKDGAREGGDEEGGEEDAGVDGGGDGVV